MDACPPTDLERAQARRIAELEAENKRLWNDVEGCKCEHRAQAMINLERQRDDLLAACVRCEKIIRLWDDFSDKDRDDAWCMAKAVVERCAKDAIEAGPGDNNETK